MIIRKTKYTNEILNGYDAAIQFLIDNNIHGFTYSSAVINITLKKYSDCVKLLKFIYKNNRKFYYYLAIPHQTKHSIKNKIYKNYVDYFYSDEIKNYYIY